MPELTQTTIAVATVVASIGNSDHSLLLGVISMSQAVPNFRVISKVFLKHQVNWIRAVKQLVSDMYSSINELR